MILRGIAMYKPTAKDFDTKPGSFMEFLLHTAEQALKLNPIDWELGSIAGFQWFNALIVALKNAKCKLTLLDLGWQELVKRMRKCHRLVAAASRVILSSSSSSSLFCSSWALNPVPSMLGKV